MLIDTHAHLNFNAYKDDGLKILQRSLDNDVWMINAGSQYSTSQRAVVMAEKYEKGVYAAVGLHPIHAREEEFDYEKYKELARSTGSGQAKSKVVAIGEVGLDYKLEYASFKEKQQDALHQQMKLTEELGLPIIFHCRMAHDDLIHILSQNSSRIGGVVHCFTGVWRQAQKYLEMGFYLGFNGIIFKLNLDEIVKKTPLDRILLETDCPYLTPPSTVALAKAGRNEPIYVKYVAEKIARIKELSYKEISRITTENAQKLFKI